MKHSILTIAIIALVSIPVIGKNGTTITDGFVSNFVPRSPDNPDLADCRRLFDVYLPPEFFDNPEQTFPIVYHLVGLGGNNTTHSMTDAFAMDSLINTAQAVPMIIIAPDPRVLPYDGSFYVDSILNGQFERYIVEELIPFVD